MITAIATAIKISLLTMGVSETPTFERPCSEDRESRHHARDDEVIDCIAWIMASDSAIRTYQEEAGIDDRVMKAATIAFV
jgi:hypothetical protein